MTKNKLMAEISRHSSEIPTIAVDPTGRWIATGGADRTVRLWDAATGTPQGPVLRLNGSASTVTFVQNQLITCSSGGPVQIWSLPSPGPVQVFAARLGVQPVLRGKHLIVPAGRDACISR